MKHKYRILGIAPYEGMKALMSDVAEEYPQIDLTLFVGDLEQGLEIAHSNFHRELRCGDIPGRDRQNAQRKPSTSSSGDPGIHVRSLVCTETGRRFHRGGKSLYGLL